MTIETKYNIGDEVWLRYGDRIKKAEIIDLKATVVFLSPAPTITYTIRIKNETGGWLLNRDRWMVAKSRQNIQSYTNI